MTPHDRMMFALNKLTKWRSVFAGWQLGTRSDTDAESRAVRDHREITMILRAEGSAVLGLLIEKGVITLEELQTAIADEAEIMDKGLEDRFRGFKSSPAGMEMDLAVIQEHGTMDGWRP